MKKYLYLILFIFCFNAISLFSFSENGVINYWKNNKGIFSGNDLEIIRKEGIGYLNKLRSYAGLTKLNENSYLNESAQNHAEYLKVNDTVTHFESITSPLFTGETPRDRAFYAGYSGGFIIENISAGDNNIKSSIDNLFSAIYHRFGFLSFLIDEVGIGYTSSDYSTYKTFYVYNMGNSKLRNLCERESYNGVGPYYYNICKDLLKKISKNLYESAIKSYYDSSPKYVQWPYNGANEIPPAFYEEIPDPLPQCGVSGYPISIQFNPEKIDKNSFHLIDFSLYKNEQKIDNVKFLSSETDPNNELSQYEYALMPLERLEWDTTYTAKVIYSEYGNEKIISWNFHTKSLEYPYFVISNDYESIKIRPNTYYYLYFKPLNCNDFIMSYTFQFTGNPPKIEFYDGNTLKIYSNSNIGDKIIIYTNNEKSVEITISSEESKTMKYINNGSYCGVIDKNLIYIPCVVVNDQAFSLILKYKGGVFFDVTGYKLISNYDKTKCGYFDLESQTLYYPCIKVDGFNFWAKFQYTGIDLTFKLIDYGK